jgi:hypothetical protein
VDVEKFCCGNQGLLQFWLMDENTLKLRATWWPKGKPQPAKLSWGGWDEFHRQVATPKK